MQILTKERQYLTEAMLDVPVTCMSDSELMSALKAGLTNTNIFPDQDIASALAIYAPQFNIDTIEITPALASRFPLSLAMLSTFPTKIVLSVEYIKQAGLFSLQDLGFLNGCILPKLYEQDTKNIDRLLDMWLKNIEYLAAILSVPPTRTKGLSASLADKAEIFWKLRTKLPVHTRIGLFYILWNELYDCDSKRWKQEFTCLLKRNNAFLLFWDQFSKPLTSEQRKIINELTKNCTNSQLVEESSQEKETKNQD